MAARKKPSARAATGTIREDALYEEIADLLRTMPSDWRRQYRSGRDKLGAIGGPMLPDTPSPEQAMLLIGITAGGNPSGDSPFGPHRVPAAVRQAAMKGIRLSHANNYGAWDFIGLARAIELVIVPSVSDTTFKRMGLYLFRHKKDALGSNFGNDANPSRGYMAWLNWGGDPAVPWTRAFERNPVAELVKGKKTPYRPVVVPASRPAALKAASGDAPEVFDTFYALGSGKHWVGVFEVIRTEARWIDAVEYRIVIGLESGKSWGAAERKLLRRFRVMGRPWEASPKDLETTGAGGIGFLRWVGDRVNALCENLKSPSKADARFGRTRIIAGGTDERRNSAYRWLARAGFVPEVSALGENQWVLTLPRAFERNPASYRIETSAARNGREGYVAAVLNGETVGSIVLLSSASEVNAWADEAGDFRFVGLPRGQGGWFEGIEIDPSLRGQGTGRSMVADMLEAAREEGAKYVALDASPSAHGFWLRMGFEEWDYEGAAFDTIPMVKVF